MTIEIKLSEIYNRYILRLSSFKEIIYLEKIRAIIRITLHIIIVNKLTRILSIRILRLERIVY